jgi:hypothetical protein
MQNREVKSSLHLEDNQKKIFRMNQEGEGDKLSPFFIM